MKIRYFYIENYPPLDKLEISLPQKSLLEDRECSIKFIVGLNGSGKSHLQRAIFQTFLSLSKKEKPPFPVRIIYELKKRENATIIFYQHRANIYWWVVNEVFPDYEEAHWEILIDDLISGIKKADHSIMEDNSYKDVIPFLPNAVIGYTTGSTDQWEQIIKEEISRMNLDEFTLDKLEYEDLFRPTHWNKEKEKNYYLKQGEEGKARVEAIRKVENEIIDISRQQDICRFLSPKFLKFGFLGSLLYYFVIKDNNELAEEFLNIMKQSEWELGLSFGWKINLDLDKLKLNRQLNRVEKLFILANDVIKEPYPSEFRTLYFDLDGISENNFSESIIDIFGKNDKPFEFLKRLIEFNENGILEDVEIILKKKDLDGLILFSELSDGEQMFLCRMSLFHLLKDYDDALLILDEPETHFNDKWKREIVDMIDSALKDTASEVLISTHSSIVLTDVFHDEIVLLDKDMEGTKRINVSPTFGADPSEVMIRVFGSEESVGRRAQEWLEKQLDDSLWVESKIEELENLVKNLGAGFYRGELRTMLYKLKRKRDDSKN